MALVAELTLPRFAAEPPRAERAVLWIASDYPPRQAQSWPVLVPIPLGYHEVTEQEAQAIIKGVPTTLSFTIGPPPTDAASEAAALSTAEPDAAVVAARRLSRVPREPRPPRKARASRTARLPRVFRPERAPRKPRRPRPARKPRAARKPRPRRPRNYKTREEPGICKGPACTCWTPAGCVGKWYLDLLPWFKGSDCFRGPCFHYELCMSDKCSFHVACTVNTIIQFWARQYRAAVAYAEPVVAQLPAPVRRALLPTLPVAPSAPALPAGPTLPAGAVVRGCPPGWYWTIGLTGCRCVEANSGLPVATVAQVIHCIGQAEWDRLGAIGQQGIAG